MIRLGIDRVLDERIDLLRGRRVGLVASPNSADQHLISSVERLHEQPDVNLVALFGPEHGLRGSAQAGDPVSTTTDPNTGVPVYSLYGDTKKPTREMLAGVDVLLYDLQDGGVRFYTYLSTLVYVMQAAAENGVEVIVLDRPNPINGAAVEGTTLDPKYTSFVGIAPIPMRHGMTAGELAAFCNDALRIGCKLTVVPMEGWRRAMWYDETDLPFIPPSPNLPTLSALTVYPGTCLFEGTTLSEGRGTTKPFEYIGAPWIDAERLARDLSAPRLPGVLFRPVYFVPTFSKHQGETCGGVQVYVRERDNFRAVEVALHMLALVKASYPDEFAWRPPWSDGGHRPIDLLTGGTQVREHLDAGRPVSELIGAWQEGLDAFCEARAPFLLYRD